MEKQSKKKHKKDRQQQNTSFFAKFKKRQQIKQQKDGKQQEKQNSIFICISQQTKIIKKSIERQYKDKQNQNFQNFIVGRLEHKAFNIEKKYKLPQKYQEINKKHIKQLTQQDQLKKQKNSIIAKIKSQLSFLQKLINTNQFKYTILNNPKLWNINDQIVPFNQQASKKINQLRKIIFNITSSDSLQQLLFSTLNPQSLIMFSHISYRNLIKITINNGIQNLQPLTWIECPNLKFLTIQNTKVTKLASLNKLNYPQLCYLRTINNPVQTLGLERIRIKKGSMANLIYSLQPYEFRNYNQIEQKIFIQDISQLAKCETLWSSFTRNWKFCKNRIKQLKVVIKMNETSKIKWENQSNDQYSSDY